jgi:hypothetical protein
MGNFSRETFNALKHYVGVRLQQGVPIVDADWNELEDIRKYELEAFLKWFVGNGVPQGNDGFRIDLTDDEDDFVIVGGDGTTDGAGRCLVEGWDALNESDMNYTDQPLYVDPTKAGPWGVPPLDPLGPPHQGDSRTDLVYLDVWERDVLSTDDFDKEFPPSMVNDDIGIETCFRRRREWVVRVAEVLPPPDGISEQKNLLTFLKQPEGPFREGHVYYPLARLNWIWNPSQQQHVRNSTDLRRTGLNLADLQAEIADARGMKANLGNRLDESLTKGGQLRHNVVDSDQLVTDAVTADKIRFKVVKSGSFFDLAPNGQNLDLVDDQSDGKIYLPIISSIEFSDDEPGDDASAGVAADIVYGLSKTDKEDKFAAYILVRSLKESSAKVDVTWRVETFAEE